MSDRDQLRDPPSLERLATAVARAELQARREELPIGGEAGPLDAPNAAPSLRLMTPHKPPLKRDVGVRELHDQLSRYVQHAAAGGEVVVTLRGRRAARLAPVSGDDAVADLRARGLVQDPYASGVRSPADVPARSLR